MCSNNEFQEDVHEGPGQPRLLLRVGEAGERLALSRPTVYRLIKAGALRPVKSMGCTRIHVAELERYTNELLREAGLDDLVPSPATAQVESVTSATIGLSR